MRAHRAGGRALNLRMVGSVPLGEPGGQGMRGAAEIPLGRQWPDGLVPHQVNKTDIGLFLSERGSGLAN